LSQALIEEKTVRLNEAVKEETVILAKETGFQKASEDTVKPVLNGPFIKPNFVLKGNIFRSRDYYSIL
jgi:hypothetical protein